jgi:hypothetical protein
VLGSAHNLHQPDCSIYDGILYHGAEYEDHEKCPICVLDQLNHRKDDGDDKNGNKRKRWVSKGVLVLSYHSSCEALIYKQGVRIIVMIEREV